MKEKFDFNQLKAELTIELKAGISAELKADFTNAIDAYLLESLSMSSNIKANRKFIKHYETIKNAEIAKVDLKYDVLEHEQFRESRLAILNNVDQIPHQFLRLPNEYTLALNTELLLKQLNYNFLSPVVPTLIANEFDNRQTVEPVFTTFSEVLTTNEILVLSDIKSLIDKNKLIVVKPAVINEKLENPLAFEERESMLFNFDILNKPLSNKLTDLQRSLSLSVLMQTGILRISEAIPYGPIQRGPVQETKDLPNYKFFYTSETATSITSKLSINETLFCSPIILTFTEVGHTFTSSILNQ